MKAASSSSDSNDVKVRKVLPSMKVQIAMQQVLTAVCREYPFLTQIQVKVILPGNPLSCKVSVESMKAVLHQMPTKKAI